MIEYNINKSILSGHLYNNHGLSYDKSFYTKHIMTGLWGKETIDNIINSSNENFKQYVNNLYIEEIKKYVAIDFISTENFDFYTDYTNGEFLKDSKQICIPEKENRLNNIQYS